MYSHVLVTCLHHTHELKNNALRALFIVKVMGILTLGVIYTTCLEDEERGSGGDHWLSSVRCSDSTPPPPFTLPR